MSDVLIQRIFGLASAIIGVCLIVASLVGSIFSSLRQEIAGGALILALICFFMAYAIVSGLDLTKFKLAFGKDKELAVDLTPRGVKPSDALPPRVLDKATVAEKEAIAKQVQKENVLPGEGAPQY